MRRRAVAVGVLFLATLTQAGPATTRSAPTRPLATTTATTRATVDADALPVLERLSAVYSRTGPLHVTATMAGRFDVAGRGKNYTLKIDGRTDGDGRFRHDADTAGLLVGNGRDAYLYDRRRDAYAELPAVAGRATADDVAGTLVSVLLDENPALLLTLTDDPAGLLRRTAKTIRLAAASATGPTTTPAAGLVLDQNNRTQTLWLNDAGEIVAATIDYTPLIKSRGGAAVKAAVVTLVYGPATHEPPAPGTFDWRPPATSMQFDADEDLEHSATQPTTKPGR